MPYTRNSLITRIRLIVASMLLLTLASPVNGGTGAIPENLTYDLSWGGIPVGTARQSITAEGDTLRISALFKSNGWLSSFYPVENRIDTTLSRRTGQFPGEVRQFRMRFREGNRLRDRSISFDHVTNRALYQDHLTHEEVRAPIRSGTSDVTTSFYSARHLPIAPGTTLHLPVIDGKEPYQLEVKVLKTEKLRTILGKVDTLVVQPLVRPEGTFEGKGGVTLWITNDARRIPVKIQTKVTVGHVTAILTGVE